MKRAPLVVFFGCAAFVVSGCAPRVAFVRPDASPAMHRADSSQCEYEIQMNQRSPGRVWFRNNSDALGYAIGSAIGTAIRNDQIRTLCMQAKGYIPVPLEGATIQAMTQPLHSPEIAAPTGYVPLANQTTAPGRGDIIPTQPRPIGAAPAVATSIKGESKYMITAEGIAKVAGCTPPAAAMTAKGAGSESFMVGCPNGTTLAIRCEVDGCRILR